MTSNKCHARSLSRNVGQGRRFKCTTMEENRRTRFGIDARARARNIPDYLKSERLRTLEERAR